MTHDSTKRDFLEPKQAQPSWRLRHTNQCVRQRSEGHWTSLDTETAVQQTTEDNMQLKTTEENKRNTVGYTGKSHHPSLDSVLLGHSSSTRFRKIVKLSSQLQTVCELIGT